MLPAEQQRQAECSLELKRINHVMQPLDKKPGTQSALTLMEETISEWYIKSDGRFVLLAHAFSIISVQLTNILKLYLWLTLNRRCRKQNWIEAWTFICASGSCIFHIWPLKVDIILFWEESISLIINHLLCSLLILHNNLLQFIYLCVIDSHQMRAGERRKSSPQQIYMKVSINKAHAV